MMRSDILKNKKSEYFCSDLTAIILGISLFVYLLVTARYTVGIADEAFYYTIPQRLLQGDRLIADEWALSQFVFLLNLPPYWAYTRITGGTEGIILFMRVYFVVINTAYYFFMYKKLRRFKLPGVAAAFLFCALIPQTTLSVSYFSVAVMSLMTVFLLIIPNEKPKSHPVQILTGSILAIGVMAEPLLIFAFGLWFVLVVVRAIRTRMGKRFFDSCDFFLDKTQFFFITAGTMIVFACFMGYLIAAGSFREISAVLPYLFSGSEYNKSNILDAKKLQTMIEFFSPVFLTGLLLCLIAAFVYSRRKRKSHTARKMILLLALVCLACCFIHGAVKSIAAEGFARYMYFYEDHGVPLLLVAPIPFLLSEKPSPRWFTVCIAGILCSLCIDISSDVMFSSCARIALVGVIFGFLQLRDELRAAENTVKANVFRSRNLLKRKKAYKAVVSICIAVFFLWEGAYVLAEGLYKPPEKPLLQSKEPLACTLEAGPFKHLKTIPSIRDMYNSTLNDLDHLKQLADGAPVAILNDSPFMYLYMDLPYATFSAWYDYETERLWHYWNISPVHRPAYVYLPYYDARYYSLTEERDLSQLLTRLFNHIEGETTAGEMGYIIRVTRILPDDGSGPLSGSYNTP